MSLELYVIAGVCYLGLQAHIWWSGRLTRSAITTHVSTHLSKFDTERNEFLVEKMVNANRQSGMLSRVCHTCKRVVHKYDLFENGVVTCHDCKVK